MRKKEIEKLICLVFPYRLINQKVIDYFRIITMVDIQYELKHEYQPTAETYIDAMVMMHKNKINMVRLPRCQWGSLSGDLYVPDEPIKCRKNYYYPAFTIPAWAMVYGSSLADPIGSNKVMVTGYALSNDYRRVLYKAHIQEAFKMKNYQYLVN